MGPERIELSAGEQERLKVLQQVEEETACGARVAPGPPWPTNITVCRAC